MEFVKNIATDSNTVEILLDYLPDRVFIYNKTNKTIYEKINGALVPLGSEESFNKGKNALHFEGEVAKISNLNQNASDGSVFLIANDTTTYQDRVVNSLFIKLPNNNWKEVRLNVYTTGEVDKLISDEEAARENADSTLQDNIDSEATTREEADGTLQDNIEAEESARQEADGNLQDNIDSEATSREQADSLLSEAITNLSGRVDGDEDDIAAINTLLENIDFDDNIVIQYRGALTAPPQDFSDFVLGTTWKITEDFTLNGEDVPKNTYIFKKTENTLDILGGGNSKKALFEEARVVSNTDNVWVANYYLGNTQTKGKYIIFNIYDAENQSYSYGHFLLKGPQNVYSFDMLLNQVNGVLNNFWTSGEAPVQVYTVTRLGRKYYALYIDSSENFEVYYTGWISSNFEVFNYTQSDLSNFSAVALGELDLDNLPKGSSVNYEPIWRYSAGSRESITEYWDNWDWDTYPIAYVRPIMSSNNNARSIDFRWTFGDGVTGDTANWYQDNLNALKHILEDETKPTYLILDNMIHLNQLSVERIGVFLGGVSNPFPGLKGLYMPQDTDSTYCGADWWGSDTNRLFLVNFENLEYLKLNPHIQTLGTYCLRDLHSLKSIVMPEALTSLDFNNDRPLTNCDALKSIYLPSNEIIIDANGTYGDVIREFWLRDGTIYVKNHLLQDYRLKFELDGYIISSLRGY